MAKKSALTKAMDSVEKNPPMPKAGQAKVKVPRSIPRGTPKAPANPKNVFDVIDRM